MHASFNDDNCGACKQPLAYEQKREGFETATCCGRHYSRREVTITTQQKLRAREWGSPMLPRLHLCGADRNAIDRDYEGSSWQAFGWEAPGPNSMKGRPRI